ncbi:hypothetical protein F7725_012254 [Dissostichus mawsoni]|uniref:Uncharacterized protein n=1 Tax=Dissostichus mawsoni TaxID=36200 RepID=A0A7J5YLU4_DISMA|nr:hypothetical protein F7725_012254 [Dissostichus mawsoni]
MCNSTGEPQWVRGLGHDVLQRRQETLLRQVSLQGVEDVELLVDAQRQELLDHLAGALLKPLAKNPPKGPMMEAKEERAMLWIGNGYRRTVVCGDKEHVSD